jgi:hypothetical protein
VESIELVLNPPLELLITRGRSVIGVIVEVAEGGKESTLLDIGLLEGLLFERLLVKPSPELVLVGGIVALVLVSTRVVVALVGLRLALHLGAIGDEVVGVSTVEATILGPTMPPIQEVVVKLHEPIGNKRQLLIPKTPNLLLYNG